ncbi:ABC-type transport auxiliary lipoprotein family protein [Lysobacter niastensis]|uniref:Membrane integrity-associated transporter subunit PqiC n=1 Tax=Lysobacter niastensis TaxID=380629 RepID=A0ABS0BAE7_9GAMM|nr:ABC-type transport auxiliary lipoprotein family protein [Lysobacter niastensis]MBF6025959.1 membrane integrity-associated transporter subunit PqiC [Lysobacter niastensis]
MRLLPPGSRRTWHGLRLGGAIALLALVAGCTSLLIDDKPRDESTIYVPDPRVQADPTWPSVKWQLMVAPPTSLRGGDSLRIFVRPSPNEVQIYKGARWGKSPSNMIEDSLLRAFEDSNRITAVARQGSGLNADYKLLVDVRRFESDYGQAAVPSATIEVAAKLMHMQTQQVVASHTFLEARPAATTAIPDVVAAFEQALSDISRDLAGWTLSSGQQHANTLPR